MPERDIVSFASQSGGQVSYACAKGPTTAQTEARAQKAHSVYEEEVASYGPKFAQLLVSALKQHASDAQTLEASVNGRSDQWAQDAALKVERTYRCLPVARS
ncbi:hypothetical protein ERN12_05300 [Rhodobacteraceae bacterium]|nr:hypothetical protein ERN12_05300 [Paracoccaceae bacterium]